MLRNLKEGGVNIINPLSCKNTTLLRDGDVLQAGEAVCIINPDLTPPAGALEFGLSSDGHPIFYDHLNNDPEVVVWEDTLVQGEKLEFDGKTDMLKLFDKKDPVWALGGCGTPPSLRGSDTLYQMWISKEGTALIGLPDGSDLLWSVNLDGNIRQVCSPNVFSRHDDNGLSKGGIAGSVVVSLLFLTVILAVALARRSSIQPRTMTALAPPPTMIWSNPTHREVNASTRRTYEIMHDFLHSLSHKRTTVHVCSFSTKQLKRKMNLHVVKKCTTVHIYSFKYIQLKRHKIAMKALGYLLSNTLTLSE